MGSWRAVLLTTREEKAIPLIEKTFEGTEFGIEVYSPTYEETVFHQGFKRYVKMKRRVHPWTILVKFENESDIAWFRLEQLACVAYSITEKLVTDDEVARLKKAEEVSKEKESIQVDFSSGDHVRVIEGTMAGVDGIVSTIDTHKKIATIQAQLFGRITPIEVTLSSLEKM